MDFLLKETTMSKKYGMVIDLHQCVGCGACALGCKNENNTQARANGQSYNWTDFIMKTQGVFPETTCSQMPVLCNHCTNAPCVENCPVTPKAMFKADDNTTLHNRERCIGCLACQMSCPYSQEKLGEASTRGEAYSVISFNPFKKPTQPSGATARF
jgi:Fe-S-cluster-containing dehydrogenase component